jgi:3-hydroxyisobutyrate dehydrogenase-like beta-hydroxyacid dehydrogenase
MVHRKIGILHPGKMGISVAASIKNGNYRVYWVSAGRSLQTRQRASEFDLEDAGTLAQLCEIVDVIVSVCPPAAAEEVAEQVMEQSFRGLYLDANAIAPQRAIQIGNRMEREGVDFVDGGIIGGPAWKSGQTWLYLSGNRARDAAALFSAGPLETRVIGDDIGKASALKMCFAAYTKGTTALLCAILAAAEQSGVRGELEEQWSKTWPDFAVQTHERVTGVTAKAWRFVGEMEEIASTFESLGLPGEFHAAAGEIYQRLAKFKDSQAKPSLSEALDAVKGGE